MIQSAALRTHLADWGANTVTRQRSPFGELLRFHRRRLGLTQAQLAAQVQWRVARDARRGDISCRDTFSPRTISNHERMWDDPRAFKRPQISTVRLLAEVFGLTPGSPEFTAFFQAAEFEADQSTRSEPSVDSATTGGPTSHQTGGTERIFVPEGREPHLQHLREAVAHAVSGVPQVALVRADPGMGKSWLIDEICREAVERYHDLVVFWGECVGRFELADPYHPIRQALDIATGGIRLASPQQLVSVQNRDRLMARVPLAIGALLDQGPGLIDRFVSAQTLIGRAAEFGTDPTVRKALATMTHLPFAARSDSSGPNEEISRVLMAIAAAGPVILVIEDVHWADAGTGAVLAHLVRAIQQHSVPLLLICSFRPVDADLADNNVLPTHPFHTLRQQIVELYPEAEIDLGTAVGGDAGQAFIDGYFARRQTRLPASLRASLFAQTGGMPLFVDSMLRLFRQEGVIAEGEDGTLELAGEPVLRKLPREIDAVFTEQLERISPDMQRVLACASVQEGTIVAEVLLQALEMPPTAIDTTLDAQLVERHDLLRPHGTTFIAGQPVRRYRFKHALLQDYLDRRIGGFERTRYHKATADAYRELFGTGPHEGSADMAWHYERAGERAAAAEAEVAAGNFAMSQGDFGRARRHFQHVRELRVERDAPHLAAQGLMGLANCDRAQGMATSARDHAQQAVSFARYTGSGEVLANSLMTLAIIEFDAGEMHTAVGHLEEAVSLLESLDDMEGRCRAESLLSYCHSARGEFDAALQHAQQGLRLASDTLPVPLLVSALVAVGNCLRGTGQFERALAEYQRGAAASERIGYTYGMILCGVKITGCWAELGDVEQCLAAEERVRTLSLRLPIPRLISAAAFGAGLVLEQAGNFPEVRRFYETSLEIRRQLGQDALLLDSLAGLLRVALGTNERDEARSLLAELEGRVTARGVEGVDQVGWLYLTLVRATQALGTHARSARYLDAAVRLIRERAARMTDATMRASYLTNIRSHRELLALSSTVVQETN